MTMITKKSESTKATTSVLLASLIVMSTIGVTAIIMIQSASASAVDDQKDQRCLPRSDFNGKDNAGNEHDAQQLQNPHDPGTPKGNPHDRCAGS